MEITHIKQDIFVCYIKNYLTFLQIRNIFLLKLLNISSQNLEFLRFEEKNFRIFMIIECWDLAEKILYIVAQAVFG